MSQRDQDSLPSHGFEVAERLRSSRLSSLLAGIAVVSSIAGAVETVPAAAHPAHHHPVEGIGQAHPAHPAVGIGQAHPAK